MRDPLSNPQTSWIERALTRLRHAWRSPSSVNGPRTVLPTWTVAVLLCTLLAGCFSLVQMARHTFAKKEGGSKSVNIAAANVQPVPVGAARTPEKSVAARAKAKVAVKQAAKPPERERVEVAKAAAVPPLTKPVVLGPPVNSGELEAGEKEDADIARKRGSWFFDQRAYPNKHIPAGVFQKAIDQRDAMKAKQRATSSRVGAGANAIINFPGDALWHLMGPQPIDNSTFGMNGGAPTASGRVTAIAVDPSTPTTVYIGGAAGGVWKTIDSGGHWAPLTDTQPSLAVGSIAIDPNSCSPAPCTTIYVGTGEDNFNGDAFYGAGILKSTDGGTTWTQLGVSVFAGPFGSQTGGAKIGGIAVQPGNASVVLASVFFFDGNDASSGVWQSLDAGLTWHRPAAGAQGAAGTDLFFESTSVASSTGATVWAALGDIFSPIPTNNGIWKSTDSGAHWTKQAGGLPTANVGRIILGYAKNTAGASATVYAAIANSTAISPSQDLLGLFKTTNGGTSWTALTSPGGANGFCGQQCFYDMAIGVSPSPVNGNVVVLGGGPGPDNFTSLFESQDGGTTWTPAGTLGNPPPAGDFANGSGAAHVHVDTHSIVFTPSGGTLYVGDDGGIWSTNTPTPTPFGTVSPTWTDLNAGLALTQFYPGPTAATNDENYGFGGTQDNDIELFQNSLLWQNEFICGDGGFTAIDQTTPTTIWAGCNVTAGAKIKKAVMNGQYLTLANTQQLPGFDVAETAITQSGDNMQFIPPIALDDQNPNNLYFGTCRVWQSTDAASSLTNTFIPVTPSWTAITGDLTNGNAAVAQCTGATGNITNLEVAHSNSSVIVAGTSNGKVWGTQTGGWTEIDAGALPGRSVTAVRTKRSDSTGAIVYVTLSGFDCGGGCGAVGHVFKTTTAGTTNTWTNITGNLPDIPVNDIIVDHSSNPTHDALYIATDVGVFACPDPEAATPCTDWTVIGDGLPNSPVLGLALRRHSRILRAATHGRSMWQIQLSDVGLSPLASLSSVTPAAVPIPPSAGTTAVMVTGINFSANTQVTTPAGLMGITTTLVNTTQLNVTIPNSLLQTAGVFPVLLTDPAGVDPGSTFSSQGLGGLRFTVMNPLLDPNGMTPASAQTYTAVPLHFTSATASEPFVPGTVLGFYNIPPVTNPPTQPTLQFTLPSALDPAPTISANGTVYDLTTAISDFTTPFTYGVIPYNPTPGGGIDDLSLNLAAGGPVPFTFTVTANPGPVALVSPNPIVLGPIAVGANISITTFQIQNPGTTNALNITGATLTPVSPPSPTQNFKFVPPTLLPSCNFETSGGATVAAGASCFFGINYKAGTPPTNANSTATLTVTDNAAGSPQAISVTGLVLTSSVVVAVLPVNFAAVAIGTTSPTMNGTLFNFNNVPLNVNPTGFTISGANAADFHFTTALTGPGTNPACPALASFALAANSRCDVGLNFTPSIVGAENTTISVADDGPGSPQSAALTGNGVEITSISPTVVATGGPAFTLTVNGGGFASNAVVNVSSINGTNVLPRLTTFVSANQLLASIPASDITTAGSLAVTVTTGGTTSEPKTLVVAQAPVATNDDIAFATVVNPAALPFRITQDTTQATSNTAGFADPKSPAPLTCAPGSATLNGTARSVWFQYKPTVSGKVIADTRFSSYPTILSVWTTNPPTFTTFTEIGCNSGNVPASGASPVQSLVSFNATAGTTYYVMVTDASAGAAGGTLTFSLDFQQSAPANDDNITSGPNGPTVIPPASLPYNNTVNTIQATPNTNLHNDPLPPCAAGAAASGQDNSVWWSFTPTSSGTIVADTLTSPYETILNVTSGTANGTQVACNVSAGAGIAQSQVSFAGTSGTTYFFMVASFLGDGGTTNFHLTLNAVAGPGISFNPTSIPFGNQKVGTSSATTNLTITNNGTATLNTTSITLTGANPAQFALGAPTSGTACVLGANAIAAGNSCNVGVKFSPTAAGAQSANVSVADNATGSPQTVPLTGTGTVPVAALAPANIPFGNQTISTSSATSNVTISNTGLAAMNITGITLTGTNPTQFTLVAPTSGTACPLGASVLNAGSNCSVGVQFAPTALGAQSANVSFADDAAGSPQTVPLSGTGVNAPAPVVTFSAPNISFGNQRVGTTSAQMSATLTNTGNANLNITGVIINGANMADFTSSGTTCTGATVLTPTQACTLGATFTPAASGARAAAFSITDNASGSPQTLPLSGTGTVPGVGLAPANIPFGNQVVSTSSATTNVVLTNTGLASLNITSITLTGANPTQFALGAPTSGTACPLGASALAAGANCAVGVKFAPTVTGAQSANVSFADDATGSPQTVPLTGTGTAPGISFAPINVAFGNQRTGTSSTATNVVITNSGTSTLNITNITLMGANPTQFTLGAPTSGTACVLGVNAIAPGNNCSVGVKFSPTNTGAQGANVSVADDATGSPQTVPLTGTGTASAVTFAPPNIAFGNQRTATSSVTTNVVITNSGTATLNTTSITLTGANPTQFTLGAPTSGTACVLGVNAIAPGSNCSVGVKFSPTNTGAQSASVSVADDAPGTPQTVPLTGTGTASAVTFAPTTIPFANQAVSTQSAVTNVTITNTGTATLNITSITLTGANPGDFAVGNPSSGTACPLGASMLNAGISCNVGVTFSPTATGARSANISVADDAPASPQTVPLTGTGTAASVTLSPSPVPFGTQRINTTGVTTTVTLTNTGNASVTLGTPTLSITGTNTGDFAVVGAGTTCTNGAVIAASPGPGNTCAIQLTFTPAALGARTATLNVADSATPSPQSVTLNGTGTAPTAGVAPLNIPFGNLRKGTTSPGTDVTVSNTGTDKLTIASIALTGANPSQFVLGAPSSGTACSLGAATQVAPAANCKFSVSFAPTATGAQAASVTITDDSGGTAGTIQTVTLSGTGTLPQASVAPSPLPFGNQRKGTTSAALTVTLTNTGTDTLNLAAANAVTIGGANSADFAIVAGTTTCKNSTAVPSAPGPGNTCVINVTFTPATTAAEAATLTITDDSGGVAGTVQNVPLTGTGVLPQGGAAPPTLAFGNQSKGVTSAALTATLTNSGSDTLNLAAANAVAIGGTNAADFTIATGTTCVNGGTVAPSGGACLVKVTFTPSTTAAESATLTITDDSGGVAGTTQNVSLTGTGTTVTVALSPSPAAFNNQRVGTTSAALTMTLTNSGNGAVTLAAANAVSLAGGNVADFAITGGTCANGLALTAAPGPGNTCTVTATFAPSALGSENTTLKVIFQGGTPAAPDNLTGTGVFPQATPSPSPVNFNNQVINTTSVTMAVTLANAGTDVLHLAAANAVVIGGTNPGDFATAAGTTCTNGATVNPAANCIINLTFTPSALNARTATLTITDDANPTTQVVTLNGTGTNPAPVITTVSPNNVIAGAASFTLTITGTNFVAGATVNFGSNPALTPTTITAGQIVVTVPAGDVATAGNVNVTVTNPAPGGGTSAAATFTINNPAPTLTSIAPTSGLLGQSVNLVLTGTNFVAGSIVNFSTNADIGAVVSNGGATLTITIPAAQANAAGPVNLTVTNPAPGGGTTAAQTFTVNNPVPTLTSIAPTTGVLGQSVNLVLTGTNFVAGSIVNFGANADAGGVVSNGGNTLTITIPAAQLNATGPVNVTVTNPAPAGGTTAAQVFTVNNPAPTLTAVAPTSGVLGQSANLTLTGTGFIAASIVNFGANADVGGVVSNGGNTLTITIPGVQLSAAGPVNITVKNLAPGGGTSAAVVFTVNNPVPAITSLSPNSALALGPAFLLTINGSNFGAGATVAFGSNPPLTPATIAAGIITVNIPAADIAAGGTPNVIVTNPAPGGGASAPSAFTINNPLPTITNATAAGQTHASGGATFNLVVTGTNFVTGQTNVHFNGKPETTTVNSSTQLTASIAAADVATAGTFPVVVVSAAPGGGTSASSVNFTVDGFTVSGPANTPVKAGQQAQIVITVTPTNLANGFTNAINFAVSGLPAHSSASFSPTSVTPNGVAVTTTLTVMTISRGAAPPAAPVDPPVSPLMRLLPVMWLAAMLAGLLAMKLTRRVPQRRRFAAAVSLALMLITGAVLAGCAGGKAGTPAGPAQLTITGASGTMSIPTAANSVTLTVQ